MPLSTRTVGMSGKVAKRVAVVIAGARYGGYQSKVTRKAQALVGESHIRHAHRGFLHG